MTRFLPEAAEFYKNYNSGRSQLVWTWINADLETPVSAYLKICGEEPYAFLLESVEGGAVLGRYSIIGHDPDLIWRCRHGRAAQRDGKSGWQETDGPPLESLRALISASHIAAVPPDLPPMAVSGLFGYIGYDMIRLTEDIPDKNPDPLGLPDSILIRPKSLAIFDNVKNMLCLVTTVYRHANNSDAPAAQVYAESCNRIRALLERLAAPIDPGLLRHESKAEPRTEAQSNMRREDYHTMVRRAVEYIHAGEIFQVVPSQRFSMPFDLPSFELYRSLRRLNPSPFMFHLTFEDFAVVGSSPEILVRVRDGTVTVRPIAGTRRRGADSEEDRTLAADLLADPKERAEHLMLLDLGRNDVGRVAQTGSVRVTDQFTIEYYSHVMHIVSNVEGKLRPGLDIIDALFAGFPAGTVSGAPKVRAMEIIDELEPVRRSFYSGGIGYLSGNGALDTCIALRTALLKDGTLYVQAGGGVVADSDPEFEYQESCNKARAVIRAAELALRRASD